MSLVGKASATGGGSQSGVRLVIHGGNTGGPAIWIGVLGDVRRNDGDGGEHPCGVTNPYHREAGKTAIRRVIGDTSSRGSDMGGGDAVSGHVNRPLAGDGSTICGPTTTM